MVSVRGHSPETDDVSGPSPSYRCEAEWMFGNTGPVLTFGIINAALFMIQGCPPTVSEIGIIFKGYSKC